MSAECNGNNSYYTPVNTEEAHDVVPVDQPKRPRGLGKRHGQVSLFFLYMIVTFIVRSHISVSLVAMTNPQLSMNGTVKIYDWSKAKQETISGSFFFGYLCMQLPSGVIAARFGGKIPLLVSLFVNAVMTMVTPWMASIGGWQAVCACRFVQGLTQAATHPSLQQLLGKWAPLSERGKMIAVVHSGGSLASVFGFSIAGFISERIGWPYTFYVLGSICLTFFFIYLVLGAASPDDVTSISTAEKQYILGTFEKTDPLSKAKTPWKAILTSVPVWVMIVAHGGVGVSSMLMHTQVPYYLQHVLGFGVEMNGLLSSLPFATGCLAVIFFGWLSDRLINSGRLSLINTRRLFNSIGMYVPAACLVAFTFTNNSFVAVICMMLSLGCSTAICLGFIANQIDISTNYAGAIMALANFVWSLIGGVGTPALTAAIVTDVTNPMQWRLIFGIAALINFVANTIYITFLKVEKQPWDTLEIKQTEEKKKIPDPRKTYGMRHIQVLILFWCYLIAHSVRSSIGVTIVAMHSKEYGTDMFPSPIWDPTIKNRIMSAFFWGYMLLQIPSGQLAHRLGAKFLIVAALFLNAIISMLTPFAVKLGGWKLMMACRFLQGLSQSCLVPSFHTLLGKWVPLEERGRLGAFVYGGAALGAVVGPLLSGYICSLMGWPSVFFVLGFILLMISMLWCYFGSESPSHHSTISPHEKAYIQSQLGHNDNMMKANFSVPWRHILTSPASWAIVCAHVGQTWGMLTFMSVLPTYFNKIMDIDIKSNGMMSALPFAFMWITNFIFSIFIDKLIVKKICTVTTARKIANSIGSVPSAILVIGMAFVPKGEIVLFEVLFILACSFKPAANVGFHVNHIDLSPNFAGTLVSISNFSSNLFGSFSPVVAGYILGKNEGDIYLWRQVFYILAGFYFMSNLCYVFFAKGERASWNEPKMKAHEELHKHHLAPLEVDSP